MHCWPRPRDEDQYIYSEYQYDGYQSDGQPDDWLSRCEIWNETDTRRVSAPSFGLFPYDNYSGAPESFYGVLALYNGKATAIIKELRMIQSFTPKRRWKMITRFRDSFWNDDFSHDNREKDLSAVTLDSGNLLIMGGGEKNIEINKLKNDVVSQIGNLQYV